MLDTIVLSLDQRQFEIVSPERFSPSAAGLLRPPYYPLGSRGNFSCVQNATKADFEAGIYLPRLTLTKRKAEAGFALRLRVEFSAPKLVFGNNFDELRSQDFERVLATLHRALTGMGVRVAEDSLRAAPVSAIHYSKNIAFTDFTTCTMVMGQLGKLDLSQRLDLSHTDYRNEGHAIRYHANTFEVTFYDKIKDLQKARTSEKRSLEKDYGPQIDLFSTPGVFPKQLEVLRMEVRLGTRAKIRQLMARIGAEIEPTFAALFDIDIAKRVLAHFWASVRRELPPAGPAKISKPEDLLGALAIVGKAKARPSTLLQRLAWVVLVDSVGPRGVRALLSRHCNPRSWQRLKRAMRDVRCPSSGGPLGALAQVDAALTAFQPIRMRNFQRTASQGSVVAGDFQKARPGQRNERARRPAPARPAGHLTMRKK